MQNLLGAYALISTILLSIINNALYCLFLGLFNCQLRIVNSQLTINLVPDQLVLLKSRY